MADTTLTLILRLRDETRGALTRLRAEVAALQAQGERNFSAITRRGQETAKSVGQIATNANLAAQRLDMAGKAAATIAVAFTGLQVVQWLKGFADAAARAEVLGTVLKQVAINAGITEEAIMKLDSQVQRLGITAAASRQALSQFIQAGLDISQAGELARAAQDLAVIAGTDSSQVFQRLVVNIQQFDTVGLRWMGIVLQREEVAAKFARSIGKTADELSRAEQQQALLNAVLEQSASRQGLYEKSMFDVGKQISSLTRLQNELAVSIGNALLPTYSLLVEEFSLFLKQANLYANAWSQFGSGAKGFAEAIKPIVQMFRELAVWVVKNIDLIATVIKYYIGFRVLAGGLAQLVGVAQNLVLAKQLLAKVFENITKAKLASYYGLIANTITTAVIPALANLAKGFATVLAVVARFAVTPIGIALTAIGLGIAGVMKLREMNTRKTEELNQREKKSTDELAVSRARSELTEKAKAQKLGEILAREEEGLETRLELERKLKDAVDSGDNERILKANEELEAQKKINKETTEEREKLMVTEGKVSAEQLRQARIAADKIKTNLDYKKSLELTSTALTELGLATDSAVKGLDVSAGFVKSFGSAKTIIQDFLSGLKNESGGLAVTFGQAVLAMDQMLEKAKSFDELQIVIRSLNELNRVNGRTTQVDTLIDNAQVKAQKVIIDDLSKALSGYISRTKEVAEAVALFQSVQADSLKYVNSIKSVIAEFGGGLSVASDGIISFNQQVQSVTKGRLAINTIEREATAQSIALARQKYDFEERRISALVERQKELVASQSSNANIVETDALSRFEIEANVRKQKIQAEIEERRNAGKLSAQFAEESQKKILAIENSVTEQRKKARELGVADSSSTQQKLTAIDLESNRQRLENAKALYAEYKRLQDEYVGRVRASAQTIAALEKELLGVKNSRKEWEFETRLKTLDEYQQKQERIARFETVLEESRTAMFSKNTTLAKEQAAKAVEMGKALEESATTELERKDAAELTAKAYDQQEEVLTRMVAEEKKIQKGQVETLNSLTTAMNDLSTRFAELIPGGDAIKLGLNVDRTELDRLMEEARTGSPYTLTLEASQQSLTSMRQQIQDTLNGIELKVKLTADQVVQRVGVATGGKVVAVGDDKVYIQRFATGGKVGVAAPASSTRSRGGDTRYRVQGGDTPVQNLLLRKYATGGKVSSAVGNASFTASPTSFVVGGSTIVATGDTNTYQNSASTISGDRIQIGGDISKYVTNRTILGDETALKIANSIQGFAIGGKVSHGFVEGDQKYSADANHISTVSLASVLNTVNQTYADRVVKNLVNRYATGGKTGHGGDQTNSVSLSFVRTLLQSIADKPVQKFASGGYAASIAGRISGPGTGTSDDIPILVSNGEWIIREKAVKHYGDAFLTKINALQLPKAALPGFSDGGKVVSNSTTSNTVVFPAAMTSPASPGLGLKDHVSVDINIGGQKSTLFGERQQVDKFVSALRRTG